MGAVIHDRIKQIARRRRTVRRMARTLSISLGSCLAISGHYYKRAHKIIHTSDAEALRSDWEAVGNDMNSALQNFRFDVKS